jgi:ribonuclease Z
MKLIILGTSHAIPDPEHENTHLAVARPEGTVLIDCVSTPRVRLGMAGIELGSIHDLILTHFHPDHVSGVPLLLMNLWLSGRQEPLRIYGLHHCLERLEDMMGFYHWEDWPNFFPVAFHRLPERERVLVMETDDLRVYSTPVRHIVPTIGLRFEARHSGRVIAYSCDTEPCPAMVRLAAGADVLIHEATGGAIGHTSASQAGGIAREAGVKRLLLIHYPTGDFNYQSLVGQAQATFEGEVELAVDMMEIPLD